MKRKGYHKVRHSLARIGSKWDPDAMSRSDTAVLCTTKNSRKVTCLVESTSATTPRTLQSFKKRSKLLGHVQVKPAKKLRINHTSKRSRSERNLDKTSRSRKDISGKCKIKSSRAFNRPLQSISHVTAKTSKIRQKLPKSLGNTEFKRSKGKKTKARSSLQDKLVATQKLSEQPKDVPSVKVNVKKKRLSNTRKSGTCARARDLKHKVERIKRIKTSRDTACRRSRDGKPVSATKQRVSTVETSSRKSIQNSKIANITLKKTQPKLQQDKQTPSPPQKSAMIQHPLSVSNGKTPRKIKIKPRNGVSSPESSHNSLSSANKKRKLHMNSTDSALHKKECLQCQQNLTTIRETSSLPPITSPYIISSTSHVGNCESIKIKIKLRNTDTYQNNAASRADRTAKVLVDAAKPSISCDSKKDEVQMDFMDDILQASNNLFSARPADESHLVACCDRCLVLQGKSFTDMFFVQCASCNMRHHSECVGETRLTWQKHWPEGFICPECSWLHCFGGEDIIQGNLV